jgi:hypothetical protein
MWVLFARAPPADAPYWPGRRALSALDAVLWPAAWIMVSTRLSLYAGLLGHVAVCLLVWAALSRLRTAVWVNHRYRFTTWRWGRAAVLLVVTGWLLKWLVS